MVADCGTSSTAIRHLGASQTQSIALTTRPTVEMQPASVESNTGRETCVFISTRRTAVRLMAYASNRTYEEQGSYSIGDRG